MLYIRVLSKVRLFVALHKGIGQPEGFERQRALRGLDRIVHQADRVGECGLVVVLRCNHSFVEERAEDRGLVPANSGMIDVDIVEAAHHFNLICGGGIVIAFGFVVIDTDEREAVGDFECVADIQPKQLSSNEIGQMFFAVFGNLDNNLQIVATAITITSDRSSRCAKRERERESGRG
jgi:hypothetical protein